MDKQEFILNAIQDTQSTIRAVDVKVGVYLTATLLPWANLDSIVHYIRALEILFCPVISGTSGVLFFSLWIASTLSFFNALTAISNPAPIVKGRGDIRGSYYGAGFHRFKAIDAFFNRESKKGEKSLKDMIGYYPASDEQIEAELAFEHLKLIYIRDMKTYRLAFGLKLTKVWALLGFLIFVAVRFFT